MWRALLVGFTLLTACSTTVPSRNHYVDDGREDERNVLGGFDFQSQSPLELIETLKAGASELKRRGIKFTNFGVAGTHYGWVRAQDIPALVALLDSNEPCQPVVSSFSSSLTYELSTVGHEAAYLIEGFRRGRYPLQVSSLSWKQSPSEQRDFDAWCERFLKTYKLRPHV